MGYYGHTLLGKHAPGDGTFQNPDLQNSFIGQPLTDEQKEKLLWIAKNCAVARLLQGEIVIDTYLSDDTSARAGTGNYPPLDSDVELT